jgi:hypothetical protein
MVIHAEAISWNRLYNFLMGNSILVLAWATVYASTQASILTRVVLTAICLLGGGSGVAWASLGGRTRKHVQRHFDQALEIEQTPPMWEDGIPNELKPFTGTSAIRDSAKWYSTNHFLLKAMPWAFTALYTVMLVATWWGR